MDSDWKFDMSLVDKFDLVSVSQKYWIGVYRCVHTYICRYVNTLSKATFISEVIGI